MNVRIKKVRPHAFYIMGDVEVVVPKFPPQIIRISAGCGVHIPVHPHPQMRMECSKQCILGGQEASVKYPRSTQDKSGTSFISHQEPMQSVQALHLFIFDILLHRMTTWLWSIHPIDSKNNDIVIVALIIRQWWRMTSETLNTDCRGGTKWGGVVVCSWWGP